MIDNYIHYEMSDEITYTFPNFKRYNQGNLEWIISSHTLLSMWLLIHAGI